MIFVVIAFPQLVMHYKGEVVDPANVQIEIPALQTLEGSFASTLPKLGAPNFAP